MAIDRPRHILPEILDVLLDGGGLVVEACIRAQVLQVGVVPHRGYGDDVGRWVEEVRLLDDVHARVCGGTIDEELCWFEGR